MSGFVFHGIYYGRSALTTKNRIDSKMAFETTTSTQKSFQWWWSDTKEPVVYRKQGTKWLTPIRCYWLGSQSSGPLHLQPPFILVPRYTRGSHVYPIWLRFNESQDAQDTSYWLSRVPLCHPLHRQSQWLDPHRWIWWISQHLVLIPTSMPQRVECFDYDAKYELVQVIRWSPQYGHTIVTIQADKKSVYIQTESHTLLFERGTLHGDLIYLKTVHRSTSTSTSTLTTVTEEAEETSRQDQSVPVNEEEIRVMTSPNEANLASSND